MPEPPGPPLDREYLEQISAGLELAFTRAEEESVDDLRTLRLAIFSDHHKGAGDQADDFRRSEWAYTAALGFYREHGYRLCVLGDAEELWEEPPAKVLERYGDVLALEAEFAREGRYERFWGNHDDLWLHERQVRRLRKVLGEVRVREALKLTIRREGRPDAHLFLVHGHQGTAESDRWGWLSRLPVRLVWRRIQRWTGWSATTPASDFNLRAKHDRAMFEWARQRPGTVLLAGHTHRPVFAGSRPKPLPSRPREELAPELERAREAGDRDRVAALRAELEYTLTAERRPDPVITVSPPCYFNTGCCSFPDGDITGIEIADGEIRLVRWPVDLGELRAKAPEGAALGPIEPKRRIRAAEDLGEILDAVSGPERPAPQIREHPLEPTAAPASVGAASGT